MMTELERLRKENADLKAEIKRLKNRGAGRPMKFNAYQKMNIRNARKQGKKYKEIALQYGCSISLVQKIVKGK